MKIRKKVGILLLLLASYYVIFFVVLKPKEATTTTQMTSENEQEKLKNKIIKHKQLATPLLENTFEDSAIRSYFVLDRDSGQVLLEKNSDIAYPIASLSKVASMYMVLQALANNTISYDSKITVADEIVDEISSKLELSNVGLKKNVEYSIKDLMYGVMLKSGNDATSALLWHLYGSEQKAVGAIEKQLHQLGLTSAEFYTVSGAPNAFLPTSMWKEDSDEASENKMSAADLAYLSKKIVDNYPEFLEITKTNLYTLTNGDEEQEIENTSELLPGKEYGRANVVGLKSGFTDAARRCFITVSKENNHNIIVVVLGVFDEDNVYAQTTRLIEYLNENYK